MNKELPQLRSSLGVLLVSIAAAGAVLAVVGYLPLVRGYLSLSEDNRLVQAYLADSNMPGMFDCLPLFRGGGPIEFGEWFDGDADFSNDLYGNRTPVTMRDGTRRVTGPEPRADAIRVLTIGDSSAIGMGLPDELTFQSHLQGELGVDYRVINAAYYGLDARNYLSGWDRVAGYEPDVLIVGLSHNSLRNYIWVRHCHNVETATVLLSPPLHKSAVFTSAARIRDTIRRDVLGHELTDIDMFRPEAWYRDMRTLIERATERDIEVIMVRYDLIFRHTESIPGFRAWHLFSWIHEKLANDFGVPLIRVADLYDMMGTTETPATTASAFQRLREAGFSDGSMERVFGANPPFIDLIHPSAPVNRVLAKALAIEITGAEDRTASP